MASTTLYAQSYQSQVDYPTWFWYPPDRADYAIGCIQPCLDNDSSVSMCKTDAIWKILSQSRNRVEFESGYVIMPDGRRVIRDEPSFTLDSLGYEGIYDDFAIIKKFYEPKKYLMMVLVGPKTDSSSFDDYYDFNEYGDWTHELPRETGRLYALGTSPHYYYDKSSWETAEQTALVELSCQIGVDIKSYQQQTGGIVNGSSYVEVDIVLQDWRVVARQYDPLYKIHYVLIGMPLISD